jgi:cobalamin biosynthesis protein CobD/CbiB
MSLGGIIALILILAFVFILCSYLLRVITILVHVSFTLGTIIAGVRAIASQIETVPETVESVNNDLVPVQQATDSLSSRTGGRKAIGS